MVKAAEKFWLSALALAALACACGPGEAVAPGSQALTPSNSDLALPQNYDLRFKGITLGAAGAKIRPDSLSNFLMGGSKSFSVGIGGPLTVAGSRACGPGFNGLPNCSWFQSHSDGILGLKTTYQNGFLNELQNDFV